MDMCRRCLQGDNCCIKQFVPFVAEQKGRRKSTNEGATAGENHNEPAPIRTNDTFMQLQVSKQAAAVAAVLSSQQHFRKGRAGASSVRPSQSRERVGVSEGACLGGVKGTGHAKKSG